MSEQHSMNPFEHSSIPENSTSAQNAAEQLIQSLNADQLATSSKHSTSSKSSAPSSTTDAVAPAPTAGTAHPVIPGSNTASDYDGIPGTPSGPFSGAPKHHGGNHHHRSHPHPKDQHHCPAMAGGGPFTNQSQQNVDPEVASALWHVLTWKNVSCSFSTLLSILAVFFIPAWINIPRLFFRTIRYVFLITSIIEFGGLFASGGRRGVLSPFRNKYITCNTKSIDCFVNSLIDVVNVLLIQFQRVLFAECPILTFAVAIGAFIEYFLSGFLSYRGLCIWNVLFAFTLPKLYEMNETAIKRLVHSLEQQSHKIKHEAASATSSSHQ
ncbi:reticulon-like protein [Schizosaccharomyces octosporus yFS286]|uniref:Reticulon-like protein n=1 Tax=Schizosaccharomyces octosporus (strain yFS286) TaxID=483514 RepID=S9Q3E7_SCHOY|nr:reticulon-like protein [Schizosaccharomyces octosporus yFS286]EPX74193.1 reticulon-like protein [Schizosaccharomyces octosporus yFS286]